MGDRGQVCIQDEKVYLYTHWDASNLVNMVRRALARKCRWDDPEYLARIIFCEMIKGNEEGETGFGISSTKHGDIWRLININCEEQQIVLKDYDREVFKKSFEEFIRGEL